MHALLEKLSAGKLLSRAEAALAMRSITSGTVPNEHIATFLTALNKRPVDAEELGGFRETLLELATPLRSEMALLDVCGTGGDGKDTFNISTAAAFVVAACGVPVAKHGNYSVSSRCGSSNVLEALGVPLPKNESDALRQLETANVTFLHAPFWHPAMKAVAPVRKELGVKTVFNLLGPLINPARPRYQLIGVHSLELAELFGSILEREDIVFSVVRTEDGYDEISLTSPAHKRHRHGKAILTPKDFGAESLKPAALMGGISIAENAECLQKILEGQGTEAQTSVVAANAALALSLVRQEAKLAELYAEAASAIRSAKAFGVLSNVRKSYGHNS